MKKITIKGVDFQYEVFYEVNEYDDYYYTEFYKGTEIKTRKKWLFFGETITKEVPILQFTVYQNIEDPSYTKEQMRQIIEKEFNSSYNRMNRVEEIKNGQMI